MDPVIKKIWVEKLRSGEYLQGKGQLCIKDENNNLAYCCWGVLCDIHSILTKNGSYEIFHQNNNVIEYSYCVKDGVSDAFLPPLSVLEWAGLPSRSPRYSWASPRPCPQVKYGGVNHNSLECLNDGQKIRELEPLSFNQIADVIEEQL